MGNTSKQTTQTSQQTSPWAPQANALKTAFGGALNAYYDTMGLKPPTDFVAGFTPDQMQNFQSMVNFGNTADPWANINTGNELANAGSQGAQGALSGLLNFKPYGSTQGNIDAANQYANNPQMSGMVNAAMADARNQVRDITMPGIERSAALGGNTNSSRTGIMQGLVARDLANKTADVSSNMRGNAWSHGLDLAQNASQFQTQSALNSLLGAGSLGNTMAGLGVNARTQGIGNAANIFGIGATGGAGQQAAQQSSLDNRLKQYQMGLYSKFAPLQNLMSIIGSNNWGSNSQGTSTTTKTPSFWETLGGMMTAGGNLVGGFTGGH